MARMVYVFGKEYTWKEATDRLAHMEYMAARGSYGDDYHTEIALLHEWLDS